MSAARPLFLRRLIPVLAVVALGLAACGDDGDSDAGDSDSASTSESSMESSSAPAGEMSLTVGGANFTEMLIMEQLYGQLLTKAGYTIDYKTADNREIYAKSLESGEIDVVPEYAATMAEYLNLDANGPDATPIATNDAASTVAAMTPLADAKGLVVLQPAAAADQNGFAVTKDFAEKNSLKTLSDLAALGQPITLAATEECPDRPFCQPGLEDTYGLTIKEVLPLGFGSPQAKQAVLDGKAQLVLTGTTDGTLDGLGLVLLEDDKHLQLADNLVPVVNKASAGTPELADALNGLSAVLTTEDLSQLIVRVDGDRELPEDVAKDYLTQKGLI
jgi:osmoprotectant transport system substrate-binding protein